MKEKLLVVGVVVSVVLSGFAFTKEANVAVNEDGIQIGASAGPEVYSYMKVHGHFTQGGGVMATSSTAATYTMTRAELVPNGVIQWTPNVNTTVTLPASSTLTDLVPNKGDVRTIWLHNASSTAAASITLAAGTGIDLQKNEDTADLAVLGLDWTSLTFVRQNDTDITVIMNEFIEAD